MSELFQQLGNWWAIIDILIIAAVIYRLSLLLRGTRAMQMVLGIVILVGSAFLLSQVYPLTALKWFMDKFYSSILIIMVVLFQEDIRRVLSRMGKKGFLPAGDSVSSRQILDEITRAATSLASKRIGALMVIERSIILSRYVDVGALLDARISKELIVSIFHPSSPIHDGAIIIQRGRIASAGSFLPLTRDENVDPDLGTRHRAAIGISQETDALVVVVSEETAKMSLIVDGNVSRDLDPKEMRKALINLLSSSQDPEESIAGKAGNWGMIEKMRIFRSQSKDEGSPK